MTDCRQGGRKTCVAHAANGCVHWMRETGVDDDAWEPAAVVRPKSPTGRPLLEDVALYVVVSRIQAQVDQRARR